MKTSVEISDALLAKVKSLARKRGMTFRQVLEAALHKWVEEPAPKPFKWNYVPYGGQGLAPGVASYDWTTVSAILYGECDDCR